ncbi:MAG: acyl-CoA thioesterase [Ruminococcus flavefaciens]|nr:acyl-CoA thioesterase [Ruminococcus flavefaciens]MCM1363203.1 acyl-CoA thioesterase [Clostridiales bacterium]
MNEKIRNKKVEESLTETTKLLQYKEINGQNRLFGGRLMEWIDEIAALTAMRHCGGLVTTCAVDNLRFKYGAYINEVIVLIGKVTYVGNTSMEVRVDTYVENIETGIRRAINHAYLICVHVDDNGNPMPVKYGLEVETLSEKAEWEGALKRNIARKQRFNDGY